MADTALVHHLVVAVAGVAPRRAMYCAINSAGTEVIDIDDAAPELRMLQRQCAGQAPQDGVYRVGPITFVDRLGIAGDDEQLRRRRRRRERCHELPHRVEQPVTGGDIEAGLHGGAKTT